MYCIQSTHLLSYYQNICFTWGHVLYCISHMGLWLLVPQCPGLTCITFMRKILLSLNAAFDTNNNIAIRFRTGRWNLRGIKMHCTDRALLRSDALYIMIYGESGLAILLPSFIGLHRNYVDPDLCRFMLSFSHNGLTCLVSLYSYPSGLLRTNEAPLPLNIIGKFISRIYQ